MSWFNYIGLIIFVLIMIPNIIYSFTHKYPDNNNIPKIVTIIENVGRYGCMIFLIFNIPYTWFSFFLANGLLVYIIVNSILVASYIILFEVFWNKDHLTKALFLSIIPSIIFLFSGIMVVSIPLIITAVVFAIGHIYISIKNSLNVERQ